MYYRTGLWTPVHLYGRGLSFTFIGSNTNTGDVAITAHASTVAGDFLFIHNRHPSSSDPSISGWTEFIDTSLTTSRRAITAGKIAVGNETSSGNIPNPNGTSTTGWLILTFRPSRTINSFSGSGWQGVGTTGNPTAQTLATGSGSVPVLGFACFYSNNSISPRTVSPAMTGEIQGISDRQYVQYVIYNPGSSPQDHSVDMDDEGEQILQSGYVTFT